MLKRMLPILLLLVCIATPAAQDKPDARLQRSGIVVHIKLEDAKGQPLVVGPDETASLFLWRECGEYHRSAYAWYDWANSRVVCGGYGDRGIEPGEYVLEGSPGPYGPFMVRFSVGNDAAREHTHKFKCWRRIITFSLVDSSGEPVAEVDSHPSYNYAWKQVTGYDTKHLTSPLRKPPGQSRFRFGKGFSTGGPRSFSRKKYATDNGNWYVAAIAGIPGELSAGDEEWKETFEGDEWNAPRTVTVTPVDPERKLPLANADDPGHRSLLGEKGPTVAVKFEFSHSLLRPELNVPAVWQQAGNTWTTRIAKKPAAYRVVGGPLFSTEWMTLPEPQADGSVSVTYSKRHAEITLAAPNPTMREWWDLGYVDAPGFDDASTMYASIDESREFRTLVGEAELAEILEKGELLLIAAGGYEQEWAETMTIHGGKQTETRKNQALRIGAGGETVFAKTALDDAQKTALKDGKSLKFTVSFTGICFRGVTEQGGGLAEVYASIFPLDDEKVALRLKAAETELAAEDQRPNIVYMDKGYAGNLLDADEKTTDDELREWLGDEVYDSLPDRECRLRFGRFGAWYDSRCVVSSDEHGYVINDSVGLKQGVKYVMYVWGGSRDDLKPDARVEFTYSGKGDDLGPIVLSDYK
jgi:hypothetical protein